VVAEEKFLVIDVDAMPVTDSKKPDVL